MEVEGKFWAKVAKRRANECWLWIGARNTGGYGIFWLNGRQVRATRVSYEFAYGPILPGLLLLHKCDIPACVNPRHLFLGTPGDNMRDCAWKGRRASGDTHWTKTKPHRVAKGVRSAQAKLTDEQILAIRSKYASGATQVALSREFNVGQQHISRIVRRLFWKHV